MEHPLIGDISELKQDELGQRLSELQKKLAIAQKTGNGHLCNQLRMAIETFNNAYQRRLQESTKQDPNAPNFDSMINIQ